MTTNNRPELRFKRLRKRAFKKWREKETLTTRFDTSGVLTQSGRHLVRFQRQNEMGKKSIDGTPVFVPLAEFNDPKKAIQRLERENVVLPYAGVRDATLLAASQTVSFSRTFVLERPGFDEGIFVFRNGKYSLTPGDAEAEAGSFEAAFQTKSGSNASFGDFEEYKTELARLLSGQDILTFAIVVSLAPILLRLSPLPDNFAVQIIGSAASGKTTALMAAASAWGAPSTPGEIEDVHFLRSIYHDHKAMLSNDHPLIVTGFDRLFALETPREKLNLVRAFDDLFYQGLDGEYGSPGLASRFIALVEARRPIEELCGDEEAAKARLCDNLMTIPIPEHRPGKIVATLPDGFETSGELIGALRRHLSGHYGHSARRLVENTLHNREHNEAGLRRVIEKRMHEFVKLAGTDLNDGVAARAAYRFGYLFAVGQIARRVRALPVDLDTDQAILACYRLHLGTRQHRTFKSRLEQLIAGPDTVQLGSGKLPKVKKKALRSAIAFVRRTKSKLQIYIRPEDVHSAFADWNDIENSDEFKALLKYEEENRDGKLHRHRTVQRRLGEGRDQERVYCFELPLPGKTKK